MTDTIDAVVAGHLCLDVIPNMGNIDPDEFQTLFQPGRLLEVGAVSYSTGGAVSNTGLALHRLGINTSLMGKIGEDLFGDAIRQFIATFDPRLTAGTVVDKNAHTSYTIIINPPQMDRIFLHDPAANDHFYAEDIRIDLVAASRLFHFGYPPLMRSMFENEGAELAKIFERAKQTGVTTSLDLSLPDVSAASGLAPWAAILQKTLPNVDVFLPSIEELLFMLRRETYDQLRTEAGSVDFLPLITPAILRDISAELHGFGIAIVGIKLGYRGLYLHTADVNTIASMGRAAPSDPARWADLEYWSPPFQVVVVGTTGAGDATIAGFLAALLRDMPPEDALNMAIAVGACNVEAADGLSGIRRWDETVARVQAGWSKHSENLDVHGWQYQTETQLWRPS